MNLANQLTLSRIVVIPFFLVAMTPPSFGLPPGWSIWLHPLALALFIAAAITDYYDGVLARRHGWETNFGVLMDPLADKVLAMAAFVGLVQLDVFPAWMVVLILTREFLITGLRLLASAQGRVLSADRWGKNKTISQIVVIIGALIHVVLADWLGRLGLQEQLRLGSLNLLAAYRILVLVVMYVCVILTVLSGWRYFMANRDLINLR